MIYGWLFDFICVLIVEFLKIYYSLSIIVRKLLECFDNIGTISHFGFIYAELIMIYKLSMIWTNIVLAYLPVSGRSGRVYDTIQL